MNNPGSNRSFKIVIIGDGNVGKTCFLQRFIQNKFSEIYTPTVFETIEKQVQIEIDDNKEMVDLRIFDTSGQEDYANIRPGAYNEVDILLMAFSTIQRKTYDNISKAWLNEKNKYMQKSKIVLIGTKSDLKSSTEDEWNKLLRDNVIQQVDFKNPITIKEGEKLAKKIKAFKYCETSAKSGEGVKEAFDAAIIAAITPNNDNRCPLC